VNILAIETSGEACSCALLTRDGALAECCERAPRRHTERLLPMVRELLAEHRLALADLDALAFGHGPGSFTGVRIAACTVQGLALAARRPVIAVSTLAALAARGGAAGEQVIAALDARMGELYLGCYRIGPDGLPRARSAEQLATPGAAALPAHGRWHGVGPGWAAHGEALAARLGPRLAGVRASIVPGAPEIARLAAAGGVAGPASQAVPGYLRREVATPGGTAPPPSPASRNAT